MSREGDSKQRRKWIEPAAVAAVGAALLLPLLGSSGLWDPNESLAAEIAREAAQEGSWLPLTFDGEPLPALPPLFFWFEAACMAVAGASEWAVRLPPALLTIGWLVAVLVLAGRLLGRRTGLLASLALATSGFVVLGARHASPDLMASMVFTLAMLQVLVIVTARGSPGRRDLLVAHVLGAALVVSGGILPLACLAAALVSGPLTGSISPRLLGRLRPRGWAWTPWVAPLAWIAAGLAASGPDHLAGLWTVRPFAHSTLLEFARPPHTSFSWQLAQVGHMAYPWFIAVPAAVVWLLPRSSTLEQDHGEDPDLRRACLHVLIAVVVLYSIATSLVPRYLPLDMICAAPVLVIIAAWGLTRVVHLVADERFRTLLPLGGVLCMLGAGSQGVDMFWNPKRMLEVAGYLIDRVYPDIGKIAQAFYTSAAVLAGIAAAPVTFVRRRAGVLAVTLLAAAFAVAAFEVVHIFEKVEPYMSVGPLARAYEEHADQNDGLVAVELDPQVRGGHVFYFRRAMRHAGGLEALPALMDRAAGKKRLVIVTSHVRALYNDVYALTCGQRITPLNDERRWYSISALESAPHMPAYRIVVPGGRVGARISRPTEHVFWHQKTRSLTLLGWNASVGTAEGTRAAPPGTAIRIPRGGWLDIELFMRAESRIETGWRVLMDALSRGGATPIKGHHPPACGRFPTHLWQPGDVVRDRYFLYVPRATEPGTYRLRTGFYRDNERLRVRIASPGAARPREQVTVILGSFIVE